MSPPVSDAARAKSKVRWPRPARLSRSSQGLIPITSAPTGTLMKKIHDQLSALVSAPPSRTPAAPPLPEAAPQMPRATLRSRPSRKVVVRIERAAGESSAAPSPCSERNAISEPSDQARPSSSELMVKSARPAKQAPATEEVGQASTEQEHAAEEQRVGGDHPLEALLREMKVGLDRGESDVHDRDVEHDHELRRDDHCQHPPAPAILLFVYCV